MESRVEENIWRRRGVQLKFDVQGQGGGREFWM